MQVPPETVEVTADKGTEDLFDGRDTKQARESCPSDLVRVARRKLDQLNQAEV
jgi:proteic killer suppression protein